MIKRMQLYVTSKCQLKCEFCPRSLEGFCAPSIHMGMDSFKKYVDFCIQNGVDTFELSPLVGEALFDSHLFDRIEYLNSIQKVKSIFFFTNMLKIDEKVLERSLEYEKFAFKLSIYGSNAVQYKKRTGVDAFIEMIGALGLILKYTPRIDEIVLRYKKLKPSEEDIKFRALTGMLFKKCQNVVYASEDVNWVDDLLRVEDTLDSRPVDRSHEVPKGRHCVFLEDDLGIWPNGDIGICSSWFDLNKRMILGNVLIDDFKVIQDNLNKIKYEQMQGKYRSLCSVCSIPRLR